jgi:hypothetical protein
VRALTRVVALVSALVLGAWPSDSHAAGPPLDLELEPLLGPSSPGVDGWMSAQIHLENRTNEVLRGTLSVEAEVAWSHGAGGPRNATDVPFSIAPRSEVRLEVPVHGFPGTTPGLRASARSVDGQLLAEVKSNELRAHDPLIFDLSSPSHIASAVRALTIPLSNNRWGGLTAPNVSVSSARPDARTGEPVVPHLASGYAAVTVVLASARELGLIGEEARAALSDWLLAGGALALVLERPEDLHAPFVEAWSGGPIYEQPAPNALRGEAVFAQPIDPSGVPSGRAAGVAELRIKPSNDSRTRLLSYRGGNLHPTPWGAAASYGLGELHVLGFRPNAEPFVSDPWTHRKLADLARHAWDRDATIALPFAEQTLDESRLHQLRRELDPNQGTRWMIVVSALLLLCYAGVAGPLNFYLARRSGKPLLALGRLPVLSVIALGLVVALGALGRGVSGRARRLTLVEAGAGMGRAAATRFRGLYASSARERTVQATARGHVLDVAGDAEQTGRRLVLDRDGARLANLRGRPWEVVVVQEDGFLNLGGGVSLVQASNGSITIKNRVGRDLVGVLLVPPGTRSARFFIRIKDGEAVTEETGQSVAVGRSSIGAGLSSLNLSLAKTQLESCSKGLSSAWDAIEGATTRSIDFWPEDVPVLLGQLDGGEGKLTDSGFPLEADRTLLRVVGEGGVP